MPPKLLEERLRFRLLRAIMLVSSFTSLVLNILIIIFGLALIELFITVQDASPVTIRVFAAIEAILSLIALFGAFRRHFLTFALYTTLLILYLVGSAIFTRVPVVWFFFLGFILVLLAVTFTWMLYENKRQVAARRANPYQI